MITLFSQARHSAELRRISFLAYLTYSANPRTFLLLSVKFHFNLFKIPISYPVLISSPHFSPMKTWHLPQRTWSWGRCSFIVWWEKEGAWFLFWIRHFRLGEGLEAETFLDHWQPVGPWESPLVLLWLHLAPPAPSSL